MRAEFIREHVAGMARVGADFEERRHFTDKVEMPVNDGAAAGVLLGVDAQVALGFAEGSEVVEFDLGALDGERLGHYL